jgi:hypothetical protein
MRASNFKLALVCMQKVKEGGFLKGIVS